MRMTFKTLIVLAVQCALTLVGQAVQAETVLLQEQESGVFVVNADNLTNVEGVELTLTYDAQVLKNPRVAPGSINKWLLFESNVSTPGVIQIVMMSTPGISGSGSLSIVRFDKLKNSTAKVGFSYQVTRGSDSATTSETSQLPAPASASAPAQADSSLRQPGALAAPTVAGPAMPAEDAAPANVDQNDVVPDEEFPPADENSAPPPPAGVGWPGIPPVMAPPSAERAAGQTAPPDVRGYRKHQGMIERFRAYRGERTLAKLAALFSAPIASTFRQEPPICPSDGNTTMTVTVNLDDPGGAAPNFALQGARLKSLKKDGERSWVLEALPEAG